MEGKEQKNLSWLVSYLNQNRPWFENVIKNLFGDSEGYAPDFELSSLDLLLDFKTKLVIAIIEKHCEKHFWPIDVNDLGVETNLKP